MAKKKHQGKKHKFKYASESNQVQASVAQHQPSAPERASGQPMGSGAGVRSGGRLGATAVATNRDFSYVAADLKRIVILMLVLVLLEFGLWALMSWTGLGSVVQSLIKL